jgi:benzodiazapine receptor
MAALLSWVNLALYALQIFVNSHSSRSIGPMSRRYETLITPAPYAFSIWGLIYLCLAATVVADCFVPSASFYTGAANATALRTLFAVSCLMNMAWIVFFTNEFVNVATLTLVVLWLSLLALYVHIVTQRADLGFDLKRYLLSELGVTLYFAWTCAATLISFAVTAQYFSGDFLSLTSYVALLALLAVATLSAVIYKGDVAFGLVAIWALVGLATKSTTLEAKVELIAMNFRACATQSAAIVAAFIIISIASKLLAPKT